MAGYHAGNGKILYSATSAQGTWTIKRNGHRNNSGELSLSVEPDQYVCAGDTLTTNVPGGSTSLYLVFKGGAGNLFDLGAYTLNTATEAEAWTSQNGVQVAAHSNASAGRTTGYINNADWTADSGLNTSGKTKATIRVASAGAGGIQVRSGSATGTPLGTVTVPVTGDWNTFTTVTANLTGSVSGQLVLVYTGSGTGYLFDVDTVALS